MNPALKLLLLINAIFNAVGAVILIFVPSQMMKTFGIILSTQQDFICYLLGACSLSLAVLSYYAQKITERQSLRLIVLTCFIFHASTACVGVYSFLQGLSPLVWANIGIHTVFAILFWWTGLSKIKMAE